jgi:MYXO-CTERM domain-containing protein
LDTSPDVPTTCNALAAYDDGRLLAAGATGGQAFAVRLRRNGVPDPSFRLADALRGSTAIAAARVVPGSNQVVVATTGPRDINGAAVSRLFEDGSVDRSFGVEGTTWIDLEKNDRALRVNDIDFLRGGDIVVAGGIAGVPMLEVAAPVAGARPFDARLINDSDHAGPGVIGLDRSQLVTEESSTATLKVRRMAGSAGSITAAFRTRPASTGKLFAAEAGDDYIETQGVLEWPDGDASDREVHLQVAANGKRPEEDERFELEIYDPTGGAGIGTDVATVNIPADGAPAGLFALNLYNEGSSENAGSVQVQVERRYYSTGAVSVTLTPVGETAEATADFDATPITLSWADGDSSPRYVDVPLHDDDQQESNETFAITLTNATGGAVLGPRSKVTVTIADDDAPPPDGSTGGHRSGSGGIEPWMMGLLALATVLVARDRRRDQDCRAFSPSACRRARPRSPQPLPRSTAARVH